MPLVGAALCHGVDEHASEVRLAHVGGRHEDAELFDRLLRDDTTVAGAARQTTGAIEVEAVVLVRAVDREIVVAVVLATRARPAGGRNDDLRRELDEVGEVAVQLRNPADERIRNFRGDALVRGTEGRGLCHAADGDGAECDCRLRELQIHARRRRERDRDAVAFRWLVADPAHGDRVRTADLESLHVVVTVHARARATEEAR